MRLLFVLILTTLVFSQEKHYYQTDFTKEEFKERRLRVAKKIGKDAFAIIQGAAGVDDSSVFRQSNSFYYLSGLETPHSYLIINGETGYTTVYLQHRDEGRERSEGKTLSAEDAELVKELTGIDQVKAVERFALDLYNQKLLLPPARTLFTPFSPAEHGNGSRDDLLRAQARISADPFDAAPSREARFIQHIKSRTPQFEIKDLSPILDKMRLIKSPKEIEMIQKATNIAGWALMEAMRSTEAGIYEYQLDAAAKYVFYTNNSQGDGYSSIVGGGTNAFYGHYFRKTDKLVDGDMVLMDYAPDYKYYTSDVTRMWPVNGKYEKWQRELCEYILEYRDALFRHIKVGSTSYEVMENAADDMKQWLKGKSFAKPEYLKAVEKGLSFKGHFQHTVGMAVHDVSRVRGPKLEVGMVFTIDPMIWIPEERFYFRIEDMAAITEEGVINMSAFVPSKLEDIEAIMKEKGIVQMRPAEIKK